MNYSVLTDIGRMRSQNQDAVFATEETIGSLPNLFVVADGMGGHKAGEYASSQAIALAKREIASDTGSEPVQIINQGITAANKSIYEEATQDEDKYGMGTTMVVATILEDHLCVANVGDSRLYIIQGKIRQVTRDHSLVEEMVRLGEIKREEARNHPDKNIITRALGAERTVDIDFFDLKMEPGSTILMCSDGLSNMVEDSKIEEIILNQNEELPQKGERLLREANQNGGKDNIAVVLVEPFTNEVEKC